MKYCTNEVNKLDTKINFSLYLVAENRIKLLTWDRVRAVADRKLTTIARKMMSGKLTSISRDLMPGI